jgi:hypothetical protein
MFLAYRIDTEFHAIQDSMLIHCYFNHLNQILRPGLFDTISEIDISLQLMLRAPPSGFIPGARVENLDFNLSSL